MSNKLYSEETIQKIIKRAAELQKEERNRENEAVEGLSKEELLKIGAAAGLDPTHIQMAVEELTEKSVRSSSTQNDTHIFEERLIETNVPMSQIWDEMRAEMRQNFNENAMLGSFKEDPGANEIVYNSMSGIVTTARFIKRKHGVNIQFSQRLGLASSLTEGLMYGAILTTLVFGVLFAIFKTDLVESIALFSSLLVVFSLLVYTLDVAWRKKKQRQLSSMLDKIVDHIPAIAVEESPSVKSSRSSGDLSQITIENKEVYGRSGNEEPVSPLKNDLNE